MGPKKKGGGEGKKTGKASKLAKMNEQERTRYLERKMQEEEELKRRKEEMVNVFLKMKLSKEERNSGLNSSKLIERWRNIRREAKSKELFLDVTVLQESFERALHRKNRHIELLLQDLHESEEQYNMCFRSQIDGMSTMTDIHQSRLQDLVNLHETERENLLEESEVERKKMDNNQEKTEYYLDDVVIALDQRHAVMEQEIKNEYQTVREEVKNKNLEEKQGLQVHLEEQMDSLWHKLQEEVVSFKSATEEKRRIYNDLLAKDKKGVAEVAENNKKIQKLMEDVGRLKETLADLGDTEEKRLSGLRIESDSLTKELHNTRRAVSVEYRNKEEIGLRKLAVQTDTVQKLVDQISTRYDQQLKLAQNCQKFEREEDDLIEARISCSIGLTDDEKSYLRRIERKLDHDLKSKEYMKNLDPVFRKQNRALVDVSALRREQKELERENLQLKDMLRDYFKTLAAGKNLAEYGLLSISSKEKPKRSRSRRRRRSPTKSPKKDRPRSVPSGIERVPNSVSESINIDLLKAR